MSFAAVQKHVVVLERAGLVTKQRRGREHLVAGNPDALRAAHQNQIYRVTRQMAELPYGIERCRKTITQVHADIATRNAQDTDSFTMTIGHRE